MAVRPDGQIHIAVGHSVNQVVDTLYDPAALRVAAAVPQSAAASVGDGKALRA